MKKGVNNMSVGIFVITSDDYEKQLREKITLENIKAAIQNKEDAIVINTKKLSLALGETEEKTFMFEM